MKTFARYFLVGGTAAAVDLSFFVVFSTWLGFNYLIVGAVGFIIATLVNYVLSIRFVFQSGKRFSQSREIAYVYGISAIGLGLHTAILFVAVSQAGWPGLAGKILATGLVFIWNYSARRYYVFNETH